MPDRRTIVPERIDQLIGGFENYANVFDNNPPFTDEQLQIHRQVIQQRNEIGNVVEAINNNDFLRKLRNLLIKWGMDTRNARLRDPLTFNERIRNYSNAIVGLEDNTIFDAQNIFEVHVIPKLIDIIMMLDINENNAKLVVGFKLLHHLLPKLVPPIDREYTGRFFIWHGQDFQYRQKRTGAIMLRELSRIARSINNLENMVGNGWRTSITKIIDNAIIGFCIEERLPRPT